MAWFMVWLVVLGGTLAVCRRIRIVSLVQQVRSASTPRRRSSDYEPGVAAAERDWDSGCATIKGYGLRDFDNLDRSTGLVVDLVAGCAVTDSLTGWVAGYNDTITKLVQVHGPPSYSRWPYLQAIEWLSHYGASDPSSVFIPVGGEGECAGHTWRLSRVDRALVISISGPYDLPLQVHCSRTEDAMRVVAGPPGADVAILLFPSRTGVVDLRTGRLLRLRHVRPAVRRD
jgi:hypothetical protein